jgi:hypothetical protein
MYGFIFLVVFLVVLFIVMGAVYRKTAKIMGRLNDFFITKRSKLSCMAAIVFLIGLAWFMFQLSIKREIGLGLTYNFMNTLFPGIVIMALPFLWLFIKYRADFWKVLIVKAIALPLLTVNAVSGFFGSHRKKAGKTIRKNYKGDIIETHYSWAMPERIVQDGWDMRHLYQLGHADYYENYDGMRCLAEHKHTLARDDVRYDIFPLYNINDPLPNWIRWLYPAHGAAPQPQPQSHAPATPAAPAHEGGKPPVLNRANIDIILPKNTYAKKEPIHFQIDGTTRQMVADKAYASVYKAGAPHSEYGEYVYLIEGRSVGTFPGIEASGQYELRVYRRDLDYTDSSFQGSVPFTVTAAEYSPAPSNERAAVTVTLPKSAYRRGEPIQVAVSGVTRQMTADNAYVSIYRAGAPHSEYGEYAYLTQSECNCSLKAPKQSGQYEMRVYRKDMEYTDESLMASAAFIVE